MIISMKLIMLMKKKKKNKEKKMGQHTRTGRGQYRVETEGGKRTTYLVRAVGGNRVFTMKVDDEFYQQLDKVISELPEGAWSYASVIRQLLAEAAGETRAEVMEQEGGAKLKVRMPRKEVTREAPSISKKTVLEQLGEEFPPEVVERLAKVGEARQKMCLGKTEEQVEVALKAWGV